MRSLVDEECAIYLVLNYNIIIINYSSDDDNNNNQYQPGADIFLCWIFLAIAFTALTKREVQVESSIMLTSWNCSFVLMDLSAWSWYS